MLTFKKFITLTVLLLTTSLFTACDNSRPTGASYTPYPMNNNYYSEPTPPGYYNGLSPEVAEAMRRSEESLREAHRLLYDGFPTQQDYMEYHMQRSEELLNDPETQRLLYEPL